MAKNATCPNYSSKEWKKLMTLVNNDIKAAHKVYIANDNNIPDLPTISEIKKELGFQAKGVSELKKNLILKRVKQYNDKHNTSHWVDPEVESPTSWSLTLRYNIMPRYENYKVNKHTTEEIHREEEGVVVEATLAPEDAIIMREGNEYIANGEVYPTYEDAFNSLYHQLTTTKNGKQPVSKLDKFLTDYLAKFGITVQQITDFKERFGVDGVAVADMVNKMVLVAQNKADITTLPEEAAHFIIEMLGEEHPLYKAMLKDITKTKEYAEVKTEYKDIYTDEIQFQKEAAGKILAKHIINEYEGNKKSVLNRIINWFKNAFKSLDQKALDKYIKDTYSTVAKAVIDDKLQLSVDNISDKRNLFQLDPDIKKLKKVLKKNIRDFENRARVLERKLEAGESAGEVQSMLQAVTILKDRLNNENIKDTIIGIIENIHVYGLPSLKEQAAAYLNGDKTEMNYSRNIKNMMDSTKLYRTILNDLSEVLNNFIGQEDILEHEFKTKDAFIKIRDIKNQMEVDLNQLDRTANMAYKERIKEIINEFAITYIGPDGKETRVDPEELLESKVGNIGWVGANMMPLHSVNDEILKIVYKMVNDIYLESQADAFKVGQKLGLLQNEMEKAGFKDMSIFHERDSDGNKTGFLLSSQNWGAYHKAKQQTKDNIAKAFGVKEFTEINIDEMTPPQKKIWEAEWRKFSNKYSIYDPKTRESIPNPPENPAYAKLMKMHPTVAAYYKELFKMHMDAKQRLPKMYNDPTKVMLLPQIRMDDMQALSGNDTLGKKLQRLKLNVKEKFSIVSDDIEYGDQSGSIFFDVDGNRQKMLPIYFTRKLDDTNRLSNNITLMYAHFTEMASNFNGLAKRLDDLAMIQKALYERTTYKNKKAQQLGDLTVKGSTQEFKAFENFMKIHVFGERRNEIKVPIGNGRTMNLTKALHKGLEYVRSVNLFMQVFTILSGGMKANVDSFVDARTGLYITDESHKWAAGELTRNMPAIVSSLTDKIKTNKALVLMMQSGAGDDIREIYKRLDLNNPLQRATLNDIIYGAYEPFSFQVKGQYALAVYDNYRLVGDKFMSKLEFANLPQNKNKSASDITEVWKSYKDKTLYKAMEVKDGILVPKDEYKKYITKELDLKVRGIVSSRTNLIEGNMDKFDKSAWSANIFGNLAMLHRSWLVQGMVERFKSAGVSYKSGMYEEGFYRTVGKYLLDVFTHGKNKLPLSTYFYKNLNQHEQRALKRFTTDAAMAALAYTAFLIVHAALDDEDDYWAKFLAYLSSRFYLEQGAFFGISEILNILNSPSAATNFIDNVQSFAVNVFDGEEIKYGVYKGLTKRERALWKMSIFKNLKELQDPEAKDKYVKNQIISGGIFETFIED